jgi:hypothetical protein
MARPRLVWAVFLTLQGCPEPYVLNDNVTGPQGEQSIELYCLNQNQCTLFARKVCRGDFDYVDPTLPKALIKCRIPPSSPPAPVRVAPDAGL